jgi:hypothetical protein
MTMMDDPEENNEEIEIDQELFLQYLLVFSGDQDLKQKVVDRISNKTNLPPEKVEEVLKALLKVLMNNSRSN